MNDRSGVPAGVDPTRPSTARLYDYYLGGKDNYGSDREAAEQLYAVVPELPNTARVNRAFHQRAGAWMATHGLTQFLDIGCGLPTMDNTHSVVRQVVPAARVVYVDHDPVVLAHARALLATNGDTSVIQADIRNPAALLADVRDTGLIDFTQPCGLLASAVLHFVSDEAEPGKIVAQLTDALAPGSCIALSHITSDGISPEKVATFTQVYQGASENLYFRTKAEFEALFSGAGLEIVPPYEGAAAGACFLAQWAPPDLPDMPTPTWQQHSGSLAASDASRLGYAAVARRP